MCGVGPVCELVRLRAGREDGGEETREAQALRQRNVSELIGRLLGESDKDDGASQ